MEQYISKAAVLAEIEKWISGWTERLNNTNPSNPSFFEGGIAVGKHILSFIDTLDVKEVDLMIHAIIAECCDWLATNTELSHDKIEGCRNLMLTVKE